MRPRLVEISDRDFLEGFCLDLLIHEATLRGGSVEGSAELLNIRDRIGVLATTSEGDEDLTISGGAHGFDGAEVKALIMIKKSD